jgi:hypothetical protein
MRQISAILPISLTIINMTLFQKKESIHPPYIV